MAPGPNDPSKALFLSRRIEQPILINTTKMVISPHFMKRFLILGGVGYTPPGFFGFLRQGRGQNCVFRGIPAGCFDEKRPLFRRESATLLSLNCPKNARNRP